MTGFSSSKKNFGDYSISLQIKSCNSKNLDIISKIPKEFLYVEKHIRDYIKKRINRSRIECLFVFCEDEQITENLIDEKLLAKHIDYYRTLAKENKIASKITFADMLSIASKIGDISTTREESETIVQNFLLVLAEALELLEKERQREGDEIHLEIISRIKNIENIVNEIKEISKVEPAIQKKNLKKRITVLLEENELKDINLANEIAILADKIDISEEIQRIFSHIEGFMLTCNEVPSGKKLDFFAIEILRELNTIAAKSINGIVIRKIVDAKALLEQVREQVQNVE